MKEGAWKLEGEVKSEMKMAWSQTLPPCSSALSSTSSSSLQWRWSLTGGTVLVHERRVAARGAAPENHGKRRGKIHDLQTLSTRLILKLGILGGFRSSAAQDTGAMSSAEESATKARELGARNPRFEEKISQN